MSSDQIHTAYIDFILANQPNVMLMLGAGSGLNVITYQGQIIHFLNKVQRAAHGRNWAKLPVTARVFAVGFFEHWHTNLHIHLAVRADRETREVLAAGAPLWRAIRHAGDYHYDYCKSPDRYVRYIAKNFWQIQTREEPFVYSPGVKC